MSAVVIPFPRATRVLVDLERESFLRRCRFLARVNGCNEAQAAAVAKQVGQWLDQGLRRERIIDQIPDFARATQRGDADTSTTQVPA